MSNESYDYLQHDIMFLKFFIVLLGVNIKNKKTDYLQCHVSY